MFGAAGLHISRANAGTPTKTALFEHAERIGFRPGTVFDVGVGEGTPGLYSRFPGAKLFLVEPVAEFESTLKDIARRHDAFYVLAAAGSAPGTVSLSIPRDRQKASVYLDAIGRETEHESREVPLVALDELRNERDLAAPFC
jgi:FkbM family methyltransferase